MFPRNTAGLFFCVAWCASSALAASPDFARDVQPLLADRCFRCHGPDRETREAGLRLDRRVEATAELDSGSRAIVAGDASSSELAARIASTDEDLRMPPADAGPPLSAAEVNLLTAWIDAGAAYDRHWSLKPIVRPNLEEWPPGPTAIDRFVLQGLAAAELAPNPPADGYALIRRAALALTGLPPTPAAADEFVSEAHPEAYSRLLDRLLASPRFGERWARIWLDLARYADSAGYAQDPERTIWRYRDWVIDAYNSTMSFDQFTVEQLAGDLLPGASTQQLLATAFHRNTMTNSEGGTDDEEFRNAAVVDRVNTTGQVWLGLTIGCAQCHDHKYDDLTQEEYYRFFAIFNNTADADRGDESPWLEELSPALREQRAQLQQELDALKAAASGESPEEAAEREATIKKLEQELAAVVGVKTPVMRELAEDDRRETFVHVRGNFRVAGPTVTAGVPACLPPLEGPPDRLSFARWLVASEQPLTARVVVNRYWEQLFGRGLVATSEDFGVQGELPSHPELLDYLAAELLRHGWDTKWLLKEIMLSDAFRRSSEASAALAANDPANRWLARGPRFRLAAEMIRDQSLAIGGLLSTKLGGPSVRPPRPKLGLRAAFGGSTDWEASQGEDRYRRGIYTSWRRTTPYPSLTTFDAPSREFCTVRRIRTNTPLQALVTLNDPVYVEAAQALARRVLAEAGDETTSRAVFAFRQVLARPPRDQELRRLTQLYEETLAKYRDDEDEARKMATDPLGPVGADADLAELAAWTVVGNVLLNLDETLAPL